MEKLNFEIYNCSSYSNSYTPEHIFEDRPSDQNSRWSSDSNHPPQFLLLRLAKLSILKFIKFGKFEKTHVCNLKRFKIFGGVTEEGLTELLETGLRNDSIPETFSLRHKVGSNCFPCQFVKIVPLQSWGPSFNFSIWYVELIGDDRASVVQPCFSWYKNHKENEATRLCLKFLRDKNLLDICNQIQSVSKVCLEHPFISDLHKFLVTNGDFVSAEELMCQAASEGLFEEHLTNQAYSPVWKSLNSQKPTHDSPGMRGGHQMMLDASSETIFLLGGWDGVEDLSDFWSYHIPTNKWTCLSVDMEADGGPSSRSCHKCVLDPSTQQIFVLGKYVELGGRAGECLRSDFYAFHVPTNSWHLLSDDTSLYGGPKLVFDHQMAIDCDRQTIYCFGGRILTNHVSTACDGKSAEPQFSGLYSYHIPTNSWKLVRADSEEQPSALGFIKSRIGHAMVFDSSSRCLYILAGQRSKEFLTDFLVYHVDSDLLTVDMDDLHKERKIPSAGFTQRATVDHDLGEVYVLSGVSKEKKEEGVRNSFWVYNLTTKSWICVYHNDTGGGIFSANNVPTKQQWCQLLSARRQHQLEQSEPCPRFAHQLVYNPATKVWDFFHYLFGGNPGKCSQDLGQVLRLDDFWELTLRKPTTEQILYDCRWELRKTEYLEMAAEDSMKGLEFLQNRMAEIVPENDREAQDKLHALTKILFEDRQSSAASSELPSESGFEKRKKLFNKLLTYFPKSMTPPEANLIDLIRI